MLRLTILFMFVLVGFPTSAKINNYCTATVYYFDWDTRTRSRLSASDVKERYSIKFHIQDELEVERFIASLPIEQMKSTKQKIDVSILDIRLVIDLSKCDGEVDTYLSTRSTLVNLEYSKSVAIDANFRDSFKIRVH